MDIIEYKIDRFDDVLRLMQDTPGVSIRAADSREATERYLARNPSLNFLAIDNGRVIGCAMCGHDGRRGYLQHVLVAAPYRNCGIATTLVERCLNGLEKIGILKTHLDVFVTNENAIHYWEKRGWKKRDDIARYSFVRSSDPNE